MADGPTRIAINRAPVLTLWAAVVAERLGHDRDAALTLGRAVAGLNAQAKGRRLGIFEPPAPAAKRPAGRGAAIPTVPLLGRDVPVARTAAGVRALDRGRPASPAAVQGYLESRFGAALEPARAAMAALARSVSRAELDATAFALYERFRPTVPAGPAQIQRATIPVSALTGEGLETLLGVIDAALAEQASVTELTLPPEDGEGLAWIYAHTQVLSREARSDGRLDLRVAVPPTQWSRFEKRFGAQGRS